MDPEWCFVDKVMHVASYRFTQVGLNPGLWQVIMQQVVFSPARVRYKPSWKAAA